jgi:hypothetical protein
MDRPSEEEHRWETQQIAGSAWDCAQRTAKFADVNGRRKENLNVGNEVKRALGATNRKSSSIWYVSVGWRLHLRHSSAN